MPHPRHHDRQPTRRRALTRLIPLAGALLIAGCGPARRDRIVIGSKNFTEQLILGEMLAQHIATRTGLPVERRFYLAGSYICQQAILSGRIDIYPEYTGTALTAILKQPSAAGTAEVYEKVKKLYAGRFGLVVAPPFGFNNTFAIVIRGEDAGRLGIHTISEAARYTPSWRPGFGYEFMERPDGYQGLVKAYGLRFGAPPRIMDLGLLYRALTSHQVDLVAGNSTDGLISALRLTVLDDDQHYFPPYQAVPIVRQETLQRHPAVLTALEDLKDKISDQDMRRLNYAVDGQRRDAGDVVHAFLESRGL